MNDEYVPELGMKRSEWERLVGNQLKALDKRAGELVETLKEMQENAQHILFQARKVSTRDQ